MQPTRRQLFEQAGLLLAASQLPASESAGAYDWIRSTRILIAEAYNPPFYPSFDYEPEKSVRIARELNADGFRYPAASYYAYFPTTSGYPVHPELKGDPIRATLDLCRQAGSKTVAYVPLNHPFMEVTSKDPRFAGWSKKFADGTSMTAVGAIHRQGHLDLCGHPHAVQPRTFEGRSRARMVQLSGGKPGTAAGWRHRRGRGCRAGLLGTAALFLRVREEFFPVADVKVRVRVPQGRTVRSVSLLRSGEKLPARPQDRWLDLTVPRVLIHEALRVDLA